MSVPAPVVVCSNKDCRVKETGKCVEGLELGACPNYGKPLQQTESLTHAEGSATIVELITLPDAGRLAPDRAVHIIRRDTSNLIAIIGPHDSGKTSLIASLYDLFQLGPVNGVQFSGSDTLHAFELACHDARAASERGTPHSERTGRGDVRFYHLALWNEATNNRLSLLLGDRAGEEYQEAADDPSITATFVELSRADTISILVDGARLANDVSRHNVRTEVLLLLQAIVDSGAAVSSQRLAIVLTKLDAAHASVNAERVQRDFHADFAKLCELFRTRFSAIEAFQIAASPKSGALERGTGVPALFDFWLISQQMRERPLANLVLSSRLIGRVQIVES
jgi:hypothetical protein